MVLSIPIKDSKADNPNHLKDQQVRKQLSLCTVQNYKLLLKPMLSMLSELTMHVLSTVQIANPITADYHRPEIRFF